MTIKAVIFDLDGTLLDTLGDLTAATNQFLAGRNFPTHTQESISSFVGYGSLVLLQKALPIDKMESAEGLMDEFLAIYKKQTHHTSLYPGIAQLLTALGERGTLMALYTNKPKGPMEIVLDKFLSPWTLSPAIGQDATSPKKPDPQGIYTILEQLGITADQAVFVGDSEVDIETGLNANMTTVGVTWGFRTHQQLKACKASVIINTPLELLNLLDQ